MFEISYEYPLFWEWLSFFVRWVHVITAIAWIGSSFYFIALDLGLRQSKDLPEGAYGEEWQVHGGGFYHIRKYLVAPPNLPEHLTWFKWESYATALSGFALLAVVYYAGAELYMIDPAVMALEPYQAILISIFSIIIGYGIYDLLCKSPLGRNNNSLMIFLFILLICASFGYSEVFSGRAALLHVGAFTATIMSANVFFIIIPNQKKVVASLKAGLKPDPALGIQAKQRSLHNNYLTLPVLFLMLANHYPLAFGSQYSWLIAGLIFLVGTCIRHYFNSSHARKGKPYWALALSAAIFFVIMYLSTFSPTNQMVSSNIDQKPITLGFANPQFAAYEDLSTSPLFEEVRDIVATRCSMCHANEPLWQGMIVAPRGINLESDADIQRYAMLIYLQAGRTHAMPPANVSYMEPEERAKLVEWYESEQK